MNQLNNIQIFLRVAEVCSFTKADFDELSNLFKDSGDQLRGRLRVNMHNSIARDVVTPRLPEFMNRYPQLECVSPAIWRITTEVMRPRLEHV